MKIKKNNRGFGIISFKDSYKNECSLQESSKVLPCVWFGTSESRMHLTQKQVERLLPHLKKFVKTGKL